MSIKQMTFDMDYDEQIIKRFSLIRAWPLSDTSDIYDWYWHWQLTLTRVPDVLDPDVGARREEEPVDWDEEEADHVAGQGDADEEYWERL